MKKITCLAIAILTIHFCFGQQHFFEGAIQYHVDVKSKLDKLSDGDARKFLGMGESMNVYLKNGNYKQSNGVSDIYTILKDKKVYIKFRKIDTLYFLDYASDTSRVIGITRSDSVFTINHIHCKVITLRTANNSKRFYYSDSLRNNPELDKDNTMDQYNIYSRETNGAVYLGVFSEYSVATMNASCTSIQQKNIDDHVFDLPALPITKFEVSSLHAPAKFKGSDNAWQKYLQANLDSKVAEKYLKIPKGSKEMSQAVIVQFMVAENGALSDIQVLNKSEVHPKLAEEAMRVVREAPGWAPATIYGEKIASWCRQPVVFKVIE